MRQLVPYYFVSTWPIGQQCNGCGQIFRGPIEVQQEFTDHSCEAHEKAELERLKHEQNNFLAKSMKAGA